MRTKPFFDVWKAVVARHGLDPDTNDIPYPTSRAIVRAINRRVRVAWRAWDWPDFSVTEERAYRQVWNPHHQYLASNNLGLPDEVFYLPTVTYYAVVVAATTGPSYGNPPIGVPPPASPYWKVLAPLDPYVSFDQGCKRSIGRVIGIYKSNPRLDGFKHSGISFRVTENGIDLFQISGPTIFVKYLPAPSKFTIIPWINTRVYNSGDLVFYFPTGETYLSIVDSNLNHLPTLATAWRVMPMPEVLAPYVEAGAFADCRRESHPADKDLAQSALQDSIAAEAEARELLQFEIDVFMAMGQRHSYQQHRPPRRWTRNGLVTTPTWQPGTVTTLTNICDSDGMYPPGGGTPGGGGPSGPSDGSGIEVSGTTPLVSGQSYVDVVFPVSETDATWTLIESIVINTIDLTPLNIWPGIITSKTPTGFRLQLNGRPDTGNYSLSWTIKKAPSPPLATTYVLSGATVGAISEPATFTVSLIPGEAVSVPVNIVPSDSGGGGVFSPTSVALTTAAPSATFTYTPSSLGTKGISVTNDGALVDPSLIAFVVTPYSTKYLLSGPSTGSSGSPSGNFTVQLPTGGTVSTTVTITPGDSGMGGIFSPTSVTITPSSSSATFTYTPASPGAKPIITINDGSLTDPTGLTYMAT